MFFVILLYAISASTFLFGNILLNYATPFFLTGIRTFFAGLGLLIYLRIYNGSFTIKRNLFFICLQIAFFSFYLSNTLKFIALKSVTPFRASFFSMSEPIIALVIAHFLCKEKISVQKLLGLVICLSGSFITLNKVFYTNSVIENKFLFTWHESLLLVSIIAGSYGAILMRLAIRKHGMPVLLINALSMFCGGIGALLSCLALKEQTVVFFDSQHDFVYFGIIMGIMILVSNIIAYNLYGILIKKYSVMFISSASFLRPLFTSFYKWILFSESIDSMLILSAPIVLLGLFILYKEEVRGEIIDSTNASSDSLASTH